MRLKVNGAPPSLNNYGQHSQALPRVVRGMQAFFITVNGLV